jgi:plasmid replication initiation protein
VKNASTLASKTPKIYKNKKLNNANFGDFTHTDYQVFLHLVSKIGGVDEFGKYLQPAELKREHELTAKEFSSVFNTDIHNSYRVLKKAVDKLMKTDIKIERADTNETWRINVCSMAKYNINQGTIVIEFTDRIMPYLAQVRERFVLYNLKEVANFGSIYTTRLYELIQGFKETGWMIKSIDQLRESFAIGNNKFKLYGHFKDKILNPACKEINDNYNMGLDFEEIKEGRKVTAIKFFFRKALTKQVTNKKTGNATTIYEKPKIKQKVTRKKLENLQSSDIVKQIPIVEKSQEAKPIKNILSAILSKFGISSK